MKDRSPAMQFYFRQFAGDEVVALMDLDAVGAHILLMCAAGASPERYKFPYDSRKLLKIFRSPSEDDFKRIMEQLLDGAWKLSDDGKWLIQEGMHRTLRKQKEFSKKQSEIARKRWDAKPMPESMPDLCQSDTKSMLSSASASTTASASTIIRKEEGATPQPPPSKLKLVPLCDQLEYPELWQNGSRAAMKSWIDYRAEIKKPLKRSTLQSQIEKFKTRPREFAALVERAIFKGWIGLNEKLAFEENQPTKIFQRPKTAHEETLETLRNICGGNDDFGTDDQDFSSGSVVDAERSSDP
jgi:hypothetical protein